jgi:putative transposase
VSFAKRLEGCNHIVVCAILETMKLIAQVQLKPTPEQSQALKETLQVANAACDYLSELAWDNETFGQFALHKIGYAGARERFGLSSQVIVRCVSKVADAYKLDKKTKRTFKPLGAISYDDRILTYQLDKEQVSIWACGGRIKIPFVCGSRQRKLLETRQGESDLTFVKGKWYLLAVCNVEEPEPTDIDGTLGVDLGIVELATDSNGKSYSGTQTKAVRRKCKRIRGLLQKKGTPSAKRHLKRLARKQANFVRSENHRISKQIIKTARIEKKALALENLKGIRDRTGYNKEMRWQMGNWAFNQLRDFISYKAKAAGVPVIFIDPRNTSRTCPECGYCDKANRKSQAHFCCLQCGCELNADFVGALNIAARAVVNLPIVVTSQRLITSPVRSSAG